jgi:myo-inositol-1-phosphate synthase
MQIKIDSFCRDSILAASIVLDLALPDLAQRTGMKGIQEWMSFTQTPQTAPACILNMMCSFS